MAKKAKFSVNGYFKDLMGWFKLMKRREALIAPVIQARST